MEMPPSRADKSELRAWARTQRASLLLPEISKTLTRQISALPEFQAARRILLYMALPGEVDVEPLADVIQTGEKKWYVPRCARNRRLAVHPYVPGQTPVLAGPFGLREPNPTQVPEAEPTDIDLVIIPALLLSADFARLGYGGGWYDRFLPRLRQDAVKVGVLPDSLILPSLPVDPWDVTLDLIVTEKRVLRAARDGATPETDQPERDAHA